MVGEIKRERRLGDDGEWVVTDLYFIDGEPVTGAEFAEAFPDKEGVPIGHSPSCWPMRSEALACHPDQAAEMNERNRKRGIGTRYDRDGVAIIPDRADRKRLNRLEGTFDKNGGYGD